MASVKDVPGMQQIRKNVETKLEKYKLNFSYLMKVVTKVVDKRGATWKKRKRKIVNIQ